jgi:branched-chain amino acid transport system permease protein
MDYFLQQLVNGLTTGSVYMLLAVGLTIIYGVLWIPQFSHGNLYMLAGFIGFFLLAVLKINYWITMLLCMLILAFIGVVIERFVFRPLYSQPHITLFIAAIGLLIVLENLAIIFWGLGWREFPTGYGQPIEIFGVSLTVQRLLIIAGGIILIILVKLFLAKTMTGAAIDAVAQDPEGAQLVGINLSRVYMLSFGISTALAAAAACLIAPMIAVSAGMGMMPMLKAFSAIIIGGLGSIVGAMLGSYMLGVAESIGGGYVSMAYADIFAFGLLVVFLIIRPQGLFGRLPEH